MAGWDLTLGDLAISPKHGSREEPFLGVQATREGVIAWDLALDVTDGDGALMPRMRRPEIVNDHLLVRTDGEHTRGATSHNPRLHVIDARGRLLWRKPWRLTGPAAAARKGLLVLCKTSEYHFPVGEPVAIARLARWDDGKVLREWSFDLSSSEGALLAKTSWPSVRGEILPDGKRWKARVEVRWSGGGNTLRRDLAGA